MIAYVKRVIREVIGDPRTPAAFLTRLEDDPGGTAPGAELLEAVGQFRRTDIADVMRIDV